MVQTLYDSEVHTGLGRRNRHKLSWKKRWLLTPTEDATSGPLS